MVSESQMVVSINREVLMARFQRAIAGHMADLQQALRAMEQDTFAERAAESDPQVFMKVVYSNIDVLDAADQRQLQKCCKALVSAFVNFLDSVAAHAAIKKEGIPVSRNLRGDGEIRKYVDDYILEKTHAIARDQSIKLPDKIDASGLSPLSAAVAKGYGSLRNCLEHHHAVAQRELSVTLTSLQLVTSDGLVVDRPMTLKEGNSILARMNTEEKTISKGTQVTLSEADIRKVAFTLENLAREILGSDLFAEVNASGVAG